jgi:uncharacterized HAD superfamily protein
MPISSQNTLAIDFDGTIADTNVEKAAWIKRELQIDVAQNLCNRTECIPIIGVSNYDRMSAEVYGQVVTNRLAPVPGAIERIINLQHDYKLIVITSRGSNTGRWACNWLRDQGIGDIFSEIIIASGKSKVGICVSRGASCLIDDDIRHLLSKGEIELIRILFRPSKNALPVHKILMADSWPVVESIIRGDLPC